jgi:hypothetical protein
LFRDLEVAHADGSIGRMLLKLSRIDVLVLDDFAMAPMKDIERRDFLEIWDDRYQSRSMILTSQVPTSPYPTPPPPLTPSKTLRPLTDGNNSGIMQMPASLRSDLTNKTTR